MFPADPNVWIANLCEPGGIEAWYAEKKTTELAPWLPLEELEMHGKILTMGGFTGPLNWYKQAMAGITHASETRISPDYAATKFTIPTLFLGCTMDTICVPVMQVAGMKDFFSDLTIKELDASHWCMIEKPKETWDIIHEFIEEKGKKA